MRTRWGRRGRADLNDPSPRMKNALDSFFKANKDELDDPVPDHLQCLEGHCGPFVKYERAEFKHASEEAQQWFLRLDEKDVARVEYAIRLGFWVQTAITWARYVFWAFTAGLGIAVTAGENLLKLPGIISNLVSMVGAIFP